MLNDFSYREDVRFEKETADYHLRSARCCHCAIGRRFRLWPWQKKGEEQPKADPNTATAYQALSTTEAFADHPLLPTDFDGIFYSADPNGSFEFYEYKNGGFTKIEASGTVTATVSLSNQSIPAKIAYLKRDGKVDGYGLFTTANSDAPVAIYDYVFFRVKTMPDPFSGDALLLLDTKRMIFIDLKRFMKKPTRSTSPTEQQRSFCCKKAVRSEKTAVPAPTSLC